jgi:hypothetical protein
MPDRARVRATQIGRVQAIQRLNEIDLEAGIDIDEMATDPAPGLAGPQNRQAVLMMTPMAVLSQGLT